MFFIYLRGGEVVNKVLKFMAIAFGVQLLAVPYFASAEETAEQAATSTVATEKKPVVKKNKNSISVPGFARIDMVANRKEQTTRLRNPEQNDCYFIISLVLEDGTVIWKSDFMAPGDKAEKITLLKELPEGTYENVTVKYDCFAMDKKTALNNARIKLKIMAKK